MKAFLVNYEGWPGLAAARDSLLSDRSALDAVEACIRLSESEPAVRSVGRGGTPDLLGRMQSDASIMNGDTREAGAVGALSGFLHAITVARQVMEKLPHVMLVGDGADRFAREMKAEPAEMLTPEARQARACRGREYMRFVASLPGTAGRLAGNRGRDVRRLAVRRLRLYPCRGDDDKVWDCAFGRAVYEGRGIGRSGVWGVDARPG